jgi:hypothetical protein
MGEKPDCPEVAEEMVEHGRSDIPVPQSQPAHDEPGKKREKVKGVGAKDKVGRGENRGSQDNGQGGMEEA